MKTQYRTSLVRRYTAPARTALFQQCISVADTNIKHAYTCNCHTARIDIISALKPDSTIVGLG